jgi:branched-chain amino acid transport system substrate-binding protein
MRVRSAMALLGSCAVILALAACGSSSGGSTSSSGSSSSASASQDPIKVGLLAPFSGDYAIYGDGYQKGIDAWNEAHGAAAVDGRPVEVTQIDDQCDVATGVAAFRREAKGLTAIIGPSCSSIAPPLKPLIEGLKIPMLELGHAASVTQDGKDGWTFRISQPDSANQEAFGTYLLDKWKKQGITKVGVIHDTSVTDANAAKSWATVAKQSGVDLVAAVAFDPGVTDFTSQLLKLKNAGAQGYILQVFGPDESRLIKQMGDLGIKAPIASAEDTPYSFVVNEATGPGIEGVSYYSDFAPGNEFSKEFEQAFAKVAPDAGEPLDIQWEGWLAMDVLMQALEQPGAVDGGEKLRDAIAATRLPMGDATLTFLPNGDQEQVLTYAAHIAKGKPVLDELIVKPRSSFSDGSK